MNIEWEKVGAATLAFVGGIGAAWHTMRRTHSRDGVDDAKDKAETGIISRLQHERDEAREEAQRERERRTQDAQTIARLEAENEYLQRELRRTKRKAGVVDTDVAPLSGPEK